MFVVLFGVVLSCLDFLLLSYADAYAGYLHDLGNCGLQGTLWHYLISNFSQQVDQSPLLAFQLCVLIAPALGIYMVRHLPHFRWVPIIGMSILIWLDAGLTSTVSDMHGCEGCTAMLLLHIAYSYSILTACFGIAAWQAIISASAD